MGSDELVESSKLFFSHVFQRECFMQNTLCSLLSTEYQDSYWETTAKPPPPPIYTRPPFLNLNIFYPPGRITVYRIR